MNAQSLINSLAELKGNLETLYTKDNSELDKKFLVADGDSSTNSHHLVNEAPPREQSTAYPERCQPKRIWWGLGGHSSMPL